MKKILSLILALTMLCTLAACGTTEENPSNENTSNSNSTENTSNSTEDSSGASTAVATGVEDGVLTVAMECAYAPYNWAQTDDSNGAVPISGTGDYAFGYDVSNLLGCHHLALLARC